MSLVQEVPYQMLPRTDQRMKWTKNRVNRRENVIMNAVCPIGTANVMAHIVMLASTTANIVHQTSILCIVQMPCSSISIICNYLTVSESSVKLSVFIKRKHQNIFHFIIRRQNNIIKKSIRSSESSTKTVALEKPFKAFVDCHVYFLQILLVMTASNLKKRRSYFLKTVKRNIKQKTLSE